MSVDPPAILVINAGSSSVKFALFAAHDAHNTPVLDGEVDGIGATPRLTLCAAGGERTCRAITLATARAPHAAAIEVVLDQLHTLAADYHIEAVGHRVVHGGTQYAEPVVITPEVMDTLQSLVALAPLHQPHNLAAIRAVGERLPRVKQVACFDTAFHRTCPEIAQRFALPRRFHDMGIRRYGFHGLSYEYITRQLPLHAGHLPTRLVVAHLGAGSSLAAIHEGKSIATSMGFTALDGLMMGTRCGNIDPGVLLHLLDHDMSPQDLNRLLYRESGLLGVSGISADMRELLSSTDPHAAQAIGLYCYRAAREIGSLAVALGGLDALVFTAGIGEHAAQIRQMICSHLQWLGLELDSDANAGNSTRISLPDSRVCAWVIPTDEQGMIAHHTRALLA